jgi:hypothetical protein
MNSPDIDIDERAARALELTTLDRKGVARRLAEIGQLREPTRAETEELLVEILRSALRQIPASNAAWSWGVSQWRAATALRHESEGGVAA